MELSETLKQLRRNSIRLSIQGDAKTQRGSSHFGGVPDVPQGFSWPYYETDTRRDAEVKPRPLAFLAQIDCAALPKTDGEDALPQTGILSFFYELDSMKWGFDPKDAGCARVFWFEDAESLSPADFPEELAATSRFPAIHIDMCVKEDYPDYEDLSELVDLEDYTAAIQRLEIERPAYCSKLLGWPDIIQNNMTVQCELVNRGYYMGNGLDEIPQDILDAAFRNSAQDWLLLFQLDTVEHNDFELMFGDCGRIYFYIRREDLKRRRFDRIWLILQCF